MNIYYEWRTENPTQKHFRIQSAQFLELKAHTKHRKCVGQNIRNKERRRKIQKLRKETVRLHKPSKTHSSAHIQNPLLWTFETTTSISALGFQNLTTTPSAQLSRSTIHFPLNWFHLSFLYFLLLNPDILVFGINWEKNGNFGANSWYSRRTSVRPRCPYTEW